MDEVLGRTATLEKHVQENGQKVQAFQEKIASLKQAMADQNKKCYLTASYKKSGI